MFSSRNFMVSDPTVTSLIHFELIFVYGIRQWCRTSLVAQWLKICLSVQGTWVQALAREDPTCHGATKPTHHNY